MYNVCKKNISECINLNSDFNINLINIDFEQILYKNLIKEGTTLPEKNRLCNAGKIFYFPFGERKFLKNKL